MPAIYKISHYKSIAGVEKNHFWFRARNNLLRSVIHRFIKNKKIKFIEVGCGTGRVVKMLANMGFEVTGVDMNKKAIDYARTIAEAEFFVKPLSELERNVKYGALGIFDVLEHQEDDLAFLKQCRRILADGGKMFLTVPAGKWLWSALDAASDHYRRYEMAELGEKLKKAGFQILYMNHWNMFLLPVFFFWRLKVKKFSKKDLINRYLKIPPKFFNIIFLWILNWENILASFLKLPVGATIVVCAEKKKL